MTRTQQAWISLVCLTHLGGCDRFGITASQDCNTVQQYLIDSNTYSESQKKIVVEKGMALTSQGVVVAVRRCGVLRLVG
ncbi:hypothetical protein GE09DRAFT_288037 [Coniochaeta sp. 2T2.1]|nr:hypothetical protein GE09DRAFT_288037 [Coniochaeta sp. 2T2.1]